MSSLREEGNVKILKTLILVVTCSTFFSVTALADEFGTREEAVSLLDRAISLVRIDKNRALDLFTTGEGGLIQKDLYVFCFAPDGTVIAHPNILGLNTFEGGFVDLEGTNLGEALFNAAKVGQVGQVGEATYEYERPTTGSTKTFRKTALMTRVAGLVCGVGYYNPE